LWARSSPLVDLILRLLNEPKNTRGNVNDCHICLGFLGVLLKGEAARSAVPVAARREEVEVRLAVVLVEELRVLDHARDGVAARAAGGR
jgi:hypothetical protein